MIGSSESPSTFDCPISIAIEKMGQYAYVANNCNGTISELSVDSTTGAVSSIGTINTENPAKPGKPALLSGDDSLGPHEQPRHFSIMRGCTDCNDGLE